MITRLTRVLITLSAAALLFAVAVPHSHDGTSASHPQHACRACKIQDGFSATPASPAPLSEAVLPAARRATEVRTAPCASATLLPPPSRAPPARS